MRDRASWGQNKGLCRKISVSSKRADPCAHLCCELRKVLKWRTVVVVELVLADHVGYFDACDGGRGGMECFEAHHWFGDPFDKAVVLLKDIIDVFYLPDFDNITCSGEFQEGVNRLKASQIGAAFVNDDLFRNAIGTMAFLKNVRAEARSRRSDRMKSSVRPSRSTARYR